MSSENENFVPADSTENKAVSEEKRPETENAPPTSAENVTNTMIQQQDEQEKQKEVDPVVAMETDEQPAVASTTATTATAPVETAAEAAMEIHATKVELDGAAAGETNQPPPEPTSEKENLNQSGAEAKMSTPISTPTTAAAVGADANNGIPDAPKSAEAAPVPSAVVTAVAAPATTVSSSAAPPPLVAPSSTAAATNKASSSPASSGVSAATAAAAQQGVKGQQQQPAADMSTLTTRMYLDQTVVPVLMSGLTALAKERPADPIPFLADFLLKNKDKYVNLAATTSAGSVGGNIVQQQQESMAQK